MEMIDIVLIAASILSGLGGIALDKLEYRIFGKKSVFERR